jgi:hypothetical protein
MGLKRRAPEPSSDPVSKQPRKSKRLQEKAKAVTIEGGTAVYLHDEELLKKLKEAVANNRDKAWLGILMLLQQYNFSHSLLLKYLNC